MTLLIFHCWDSWYVRICIWEVHAQCTTMCSYTTASGGQWGSYPSCGFKLVYTESGHTVTTPHNVACKQLLWKPSNNKDHLLRLLWAWVQPVNFQRIPVYTLRPTQSPCVNVLHNVTLSDERHNGPWRSHTFPMTSKSPCAIMHQLTADWATHSCW